MSKRVVTVAGRTQLSTTPTHLKTHFGATVDLTSELACITEKHAVDVTAGLTGSELVDVVFVRETLLCYLV